MTELSLTERFAKREYGRPCPKCGSWHIKPQTPIKIDLDGDEFENPKKLIGKWARAIKETGGILKGPCYLICFDCGHKGPAVVCSGRTSEDVGQDPKVWAEMKRLWREQP